MPALDKWLIYDSPRINWQPHAGQLVVAENTCRHQVLAAGRRLGKSFLGGTDKLLPEVFYTRPLASTLLSEGKKRVFWIVGPNFCLDKDTEILTTRGWLKYDEVRMGDQTLGIDEDGLAKWVNIDAVNIFAPERRQMVQMKMRGHDSLSTLNHKWLVEYGTQNYGDGKRHVLGTRFVESQNLGKANEYVPCARPVTNLPQESKYTDALVELVAWYWTEGYYRSPGIEIAQSKSANLENWIKIARALISFCDFYTYNGNSFYVRGEISQAIWQHAPGKEKKLNYKFINELTHAQLGIFINTSVKADGHWRDRGSKGLETVVFQKHRHNLDVLQMACQLYGLQTNLYQRSDNLWTLQIFSRNQFCPASARRSGKYKVVDYDGIIWCPTTSTHTWLARRNGTVYFTGNSDSEKEFRVIWNWIKKLEIPMERRSYNSPETGDMQIVLWGGAMEITAKSAQIPERLVGEGLSGVIMSEAAKLKDTIWPKYIRPTLADYNGWSFHSSTPEGKNWFYDLYRNSQDPANLNWAGWRMPAWINHYVYKTPTKEEDVMKLLELQHKSSNSVYKLAAQHNLQIDQEILDSINELTTEAFLQEIAADFTEFVGRVFKEFDEEKHVTDLTYNPGWQTVAAVDYGFHNPNVWLLIQIGPWGEINVLNEIYEEGLDPEDFADEIRWREMNPPNLRYFFPDPADPGASRILEKKLNIKARGGTGGELNNRLNWIRKALREPRVVIEEYWQEPDLPAQSIRPRLLFDRKCKRTIEDMLNYRYPEKRTEETSTKRYELPMKKDDHGPEALGRFFAGMFGQFGKPHTGTRIYDASFSDRGNTAADQFDYSDPNRFEFTKSLEFRRPAMYERRREDFPVINDALANYLEGKYDNA